MPHPRVPDVRARILNFQSLAKYLFSLYNTYLQGFFLNDILIFCYFTMENGFVPVILATQEAEIRRILVSDKPGQIVLEILSQKYPTQKKDWWSG
jgi:hypothetical protein